MKTDMKLHSLGALPSLGIVLPMILAVNVGSAQAQKTNPHDFIQNASELMEYEIRNQEGERLGTFNDIAINTDNAHIEFVAVGPGDSLRLVPPQALRVSPSQRHLVLDVETNRWEEAPTAGRNDLETLTDQDQAREIYRYYGFTHRPAIAMTGGQQEFGAPDRAEKSRLPIDPVAPSGQPRMMPPTLAPGDPSLRRSVPNVTPSDSIQAQEDAPAAREFGSPPDREMAKQEKLVWGSDLLGQKVTGADQQAIGEITDLIVDLHVGYVQHVIVSFDGPDAQTFALPFRDISIGEDGNVSVEQNLADLGEAKEFEPRVARLRRYEAFRYDADQTVEFAAPTSRPEESEASDESEALEKSEADQSEEAVEK